MTSMKDLMNWSRGRGDVPVVWQEADKPFLTLQHEMNRLFDEMWHGFSPVARAGGPFMPLIDVVETKKDIRVSMELPGMDEKNIEVSLTPDSLTIRGTKEEKSEEKEADRYRMERCYGRFERTIPLHREVLSDKAEASFRNGVLTVVLPKKAVAEVTRKLEIKTA